MSAVSPTGGPSSTGSTTASPDRADGDRAGGGGHGWWSGRSGLVLAGLVLAVAVYLTVGILTMTVPPGAEAPGPAFFPTIIAAACYALAAALVVHYVRTPEAPADTDGVEAIEPAADGAFTDWWSLGLSVGGFLAFALLLNPLGWILAAALLFWVLAQAMGSTSPLRDVAIALVLSCAVQVAFSVGLGLALPSGILEGVL